MMDKYLGELDAAGAAVVIVADHGMKDKHTPDGKPDVIYLQDVLDRKFGDGKTKVILPITDPYVVHQGGRHHCGVGRCQAQQGHWHVCLQARSFGA
jgi:phosphonoacetate hydrolase